MLDDDDDRFLYGDSVDAEEVPQPAVATSAPDPIPLEQVEALASTQGVVAKLEAKVVGDLNGSRQDSESRDSAENQEPREAAEEPEEAEDEEEEGDDDDSEDDIEIITEAPARSLDFRQRPPTGRPGAASFSTPTRPQPGPSLTTEYTPRERGSATKLPATPQPTSTPSGGQPVSASAQAQMQGTPQDGIDTSSLPVAPAPPSHPHIDPDAIGMLDGRSILEIDLNALAEKNWRRSGADISDWFNYGFDEISWEAYCYRRREVNEVANVLKANVLNFAGMPEEQVASLPPELRTMIMALVASGGGNPAAMMPNMNMNGPMMNPMMNMGPMMGPMMHDMGPAELGMVGQGMGQGMGMGMGAGMGGQGMGGQGMGGQGMGGQGIGGQGMGGQGMGGPGMGGPGMVGPNMNDGALSGGVVIGSAGPVQGQGRATPDVQMGIMADSFQGGPQSGPQTGMMMGIGGDFGMQDVNQQIYPNMEGNGAPAPSTTPTRGGPPGHFRGRGIPQNTGLRGVRGGGFAGRGRALPVRPASPLPPNVPTGPRNKNKYKDVDGSAPAVDGLDYGGGKDRTTPPDYDDRNTRKRRSSPGLDDRGPKRR